MKGRAMDNAIRSALVVLGSVAFGYLSLQLGFKPFLEKAEEYERSHQPQSFSSKQQPDSSFTSRDAQEGRWEDSNGKSREEKV